MQTPIYVELFKIKDFKKFDRIVMININSVELWIYYGQSIKVSAFEKRSINDTGYKSSINLGDTYIINWEAFDSKVPKKVKDKMLEGFKKNLMNLRETTKNEKILVIANPPYSIGNKVTKKIIEILQPDEYINLMPASKYKKGELYKYVASSEPSPEGIFEDAVTYPVICSLRKEKDSKKTKEEFQLENFNKKFYKFYEQNYKKSRTWIRTTLPGSWESKTKEECLEKLRVLNNRKDFMYTRRTVLDGTHKTSKCHDYKWNIEKNQSIPLTYDSSKKTYRPTVGFIHFNNEVEFDNFCNYWYRGNLSNKLLQGLNVMVDFPDPYAIPRIDWNRAWTDEEILKEYGFTEEEIKEIISAPDPRSNKG